MLDQHIFRHNAAAAFAALAVLLVCETAHAGALQAAEGLVKRGLENSAHSAAKSDSHQLRVTPQMSERQSVRTQEDNSSPGELWKHKLIEGATDPYTACIPGSKRPEDCALRDNPHR